MVTLSSNWLTKIKLKALRSGVWFKLDRVSRGIVDLSIRCVKGFVRSLRLKEVLSTIVDKILSLLPESRIWILGLDLAVKNVKSALEWGYYDALSWLKSEAYIKLLGLNRLNELKVVA